MCKLFQRSKRSNESIYLLRKTWYGGRSLWLAARRGTKVNPDRATWVLFRKCQLDSSGGGAHYRDGCNRLSANILFLGFKKLVILRYPFRLTDLRSACIAFIQLPLTNLSPSHEWWMFVTKFLQHGSSPIFFSFCCGLKKKLIDRFIWLCWILVVAHRIFHCGMWDRVPWLRGQTWAPCIRRRGS